MIDWYTSGHKRMKVCSDVKDYGKMAYSDLMPKEPSKQKKYDSSKAVDYSDPFSVSNMLDGIDSGKFGSVTKEIEALCSQRMQTLKPHLAIDPTLIYKALNGDTKSMDSQSSHQDFISLDDDRAANNSRALSFPVIIVDSDDEDAGDQKPSYPYHSIFPGNSPSGHLLGNSPSGHLLGNAPNVSFLGDPPSGFLLSDPPSGFLLGDPPSGFLLGNQPSGSLLGNPPSGSLLGNPPSGSLGNPPSGFLVNNLIRENLTEGKTLKEEKNLHAAAEGTPKDKGVYVGVEDEATEEDMNPAKKDDGLTDIWNEMNFAIESMKDAAEDPLFDEHEREDDEDCDHSYVLKDDLGYVCRVCGVVKRGIETIFDFQYVKSTRSTRTFKSDPRDRDSNGILSEKVKLTDNEFIVTEISAHPRHRKQMKPHQVEGFNFLISNLITDNPCGCILAHAPGSGKTFMIISFMQSFMSKYPHARPLVVLPKGILSIWKKEFQTWQVEDIRLHDFYSVKAETRLQQLEVLKQWVEEKSILFLGYKQFATIVCGNGESKTTNVCKEILLKNPSILILDEGHTPRNENTDVLHSLAKVQTPRKVVLSGTLYQNHVKEVFNILNLVRPKFLKQDTSRVVVKRIMSRVQIMGVRKQVKSNADLAFFDLVEHTLQKDEDFRRKVTVIQDLREMTSKILHYYKGDFLDELPGLEDFTVLLKLTPKQKPELEKLKRLGTKFKRSSVGSAVFMHPQLKVFSDNIPADGEKLSAVTDEKMDEMLQKLDVKDGVKAKFFLNMLSMCQRSGEKLLVFSQYLLPLKFLERLTMKYKGWSSGKEIYMITGDSSSEVREWSMDRFNNFPDSKVFFGSIKACGEGISLVGASRIIILDVHLNPSVTRQAIGRAFRPGQKNKVYTYRLVAADTPEEEDHLTCFRKELISKMWFEWNEYCGHNDFEVKTVEPNESGDRFLENSSFQEDIKVLYRR